RLAVHPRPWVDVAVEDQRPDPLREKVRVGGAEHRAPGDPPVAQSPLAHGAAQEVHVPGRIRGRHMSQKAAVGLLTAATEGAVAPDPSRLLGLADGKGVAHLSDPGEEAVLVLLRVKALHRGAVAGAARV